MLAPPQPTLAPTRWRDRLARNLFLGPLENLQSGELTFVDSAGTHRFGKPGDLSATVTIHDARCFGDMLLGGSLAAGESYMRGRWTTNDLTSLIRIVLRNPQVFAPLDGWCSRIGGWFDRIGHLWRRNSRSGSKANIAAHYDLGNDFYQLLLDPTLMYSGAWFDQEHTPLEQAAVAKLERTARKLELTSRDHVLEIGTGWGGFAIHAAREYGCRVTTTTISRRQFDVATQRVREAGLEGRVRVLLEDYRDLTGSYDKLVSIEMIEAVGHEYLDAFFRVCSQRLKPDGIGLIQAITIRDQEYDAYRRRVDFIQKHIFPGGCLPSLTALCQSMTRSSALRMIGLEDWTPHYARTLQHWHARFLGRVDEARTLGYTDDFLRMWEYYLCYCEGGFLERNIGLVQMVMGR